MVENLNLWISSVREHYDTLSHFLKSRPQKIKEIFNFPTPINPESHHYYTSSLWSLNTAAFCLREAWGLRMLLQFCLQGPNDRKEWALFCSSPFFFVNESAIKFALGYITSTFFLQEIISIPNLLIIAFKRVSWLFS